MITRYGMSDNMSNLVFSDESDEVFIGRDFGHTRIYSEEIAAQIDREVKNIIDISYGRTLELLRHNINRLHIIANALLEREKLEGPEFDDLFGSVPEISGSMA
jgi:cell division protease FtsH